MSKCCWKNGADELAQSSVATNLQFVVFFFTISAKYDKMSCLYFPLSTAHLHGDRLEAAQIQHCQV